MFRRLFSAIAALAIIAGSQPDASQAERIPSPAADARTVVHVLNRLGFGATPAAIQAVKSMGVAAYVEAQLHPEKLADEAMTARLAALTTLSKSSQELAEEYFLPAIRARRQQQRRPGRNETGDAPPSPDSPQPAAGQPAVMRAQRTPLAELSQQKMLRALYSEHQLAEVLTDFWFNHFNVFPGKGQVRVYLTEYERDVIRPHVFGRFRDLLGATARSPAMIFYLDNWQSTAPAGARTSADTAIDNRRGRLQRMPGTRPPRQRPVRPQERAMTGLPQAQVRRGLNENYARELMELHTLGVDGGYTQKDVQEIARAFTGWTITNPRAGGAFRFDPRLHDDGEKIVLGHRLPAGGGERDGERVLDVLAKHPSTARFIATKLARRFVADDPPAGLIERAADRFRQTDGDLREVVRTILTSPEFLAPEAYRAKVKTPFEFVTSAVRATGHDVANAMPLVQAVRDLGMPLYGAQPPTGYADRAAAWVNSGALLGRMNFALTLSGGRLRGGVPGAPFRAPSAEDTRTSLIATALAGDVSESTLATMSKATTAARAAALILGSPEFQKR